MAAEEYFAFPDPIRIDRAEYFALSPIPLPVPFKDGTGGIRRASLFGDWVRFYDSEGVCGEGPCTPLMKSYFIPRLLSEDAMPYRELRKKLFWSVRNFGWQSAHIRELGALDLVLLDILSRRAGQPLHRFLGAGTDTAAVYKGGGSVLLSDEDLVRDLLRFKNEGYSQTKFKIGGGPDWKTDIRRLEKARKALGDGFGIAVDANQAWDADTAFAFAREASAFHVSWFEEPVHAYDMEGIALLARKLADAGIDVPLAFGESVRSAYAFSEYAKAGVRHLQPANPALWNLGEAMKVRDLAAQKGLALSTGGITFENIVLGALYGDKGMIEYHQPIMEVIVPYLALPFSVEKGKAKLPMIPGAPMRLDFARLKSDGLLAGISYSYRGKEA